MTQKPETKAPRPALLAEVSGLTIGYDRRGEIVPAVEDVSLQISRGEIVAIVGESGSGKTTTARALVGLLPSVSRIETGTIMIDDVDILSAPAATVRALRGCYIGFVPQDPTAALNPLQKVQTQLSEALTVHKFEATRERLVATLSRAGLSDPERCLNLYPHEMSGGMRQRVLIAIATACNPQLLVADEPTSALDVTVQKKILDNLAELNRNHSIGIILITHDISLALSRADRIVVMSGGRVVETGTAQQIGSAPREEYTRKLLASNPSMSSPIISSTPTQVAATDGAKPIVETRALVKEFGRGSQLHRAVDEVSLSIYPRETLAIVGESGSGKTTFSRLVMGLDTPTSGEVLFDGESTSRSSNRAKRERRRAMQMVYQSPYASLDPRFPVGRSVAEPLVSFGIGNRRDQERRVKELFDRVSLPSNFIERRPRELSGGQLQRVAIARALALNPRLVALDEPVSALDVTVQAQILTLLVELQAELGLTYLFVSHDLAVVRMISTRVAIMQHGRVVEEGDVETVFSDPQQAYTRELINAIPTWSDSPDRTEVKGIAS